MPVGQQPTEINTGYAEVENTTSLKVYYKLKPNDSWIVDRSLVCVGHSKTKGSKIGSAQFVVLNYNNDEVDTEWSRTELAMRYNAAVRYNIDMSTGYKTPYIVKVVDNFDGREGAVWQGYLSTASQDFIAERATVTGLTFAGLLDQQQIIGGWYISTVEDGGFYNMVDYYYDYVPVYNPKGIGNKSPYVLQPQVIYPAWGIDNTLVKSTLTDDNLWTVRDLLNQIFARCTGPLFSVATEADADVYTPNFWIWAKDLLREEYPFDVSAVESVLENSPTLNGYTLQGKTLWEAIVELIESVDGLTVSEEMEGLSIPAEDGGEPEVTSSNQRPYFKFINLKG